VGDDVGEGPAGLPDPAELGVSQSTSKAPARLLSFPRPDWSAARRKRALAPEQQFQSSLCSGYTKKRGILRLEDRRFPKLIVTEISDFKLSAVHARFLAALRFAAVAGYACCPHHRGTTSSVNPLQTGFIQVAQSHFLESEFPGFFHRCSPFGILTKRRAALKLLRT
jgi:hypothetical protein